MKVKIEMDCPVGCIEGLLKNIIEQVYRNGCIDSGGQGGGTFYSAKVFKQ